MTKQGVVVPEGVPGVRYPPPRPGSTNLKSKVSKLEVGVGRRISSWVESMRASSPTHVRPCDEKNNNWMTDHPSALGMFEEIVKASLGKQIVMFLDYDGTLSPIVEDPDKAFMSDAMRAAVRDVARCFPTAIVSGRCRDKVFNFVRLGGLYYAGSHGMDIEGPKRSKGSEAVQFQAAGEYLPMIDEVYTALVDKMEDIEGAKVENNKYCLSVHFRCVDEKRWSSLAEQVRSVLKNYPKLRLTQGRKVLEIRPTVKWDKGKALEFLLESLGFASCNKVLPVYIGDDRTDEDAFRMLEDRGQGFGILVSKMPRETSASYTLQEPSEVMDFLHRLVEWKTLLLPTPVEM